MPSGDSQKGQSITSPFCKLLAARHLEIKGRKKEGQSITSRSNFPECGIELSRAFWMDLSGCGDGGLRRSGFSESNPEQHPHWEMV